MKRKLIQGLVVFLFLFCESSYAQEATTSSGGMVTGSGGSVSYSVGQVSYSYITGSNGKINQGVQQPYELFVTGVTANKNIQLEMIIYPNPVNAILNLKIDKTADLQGLIYLLYDTKGSILLQKNVANEVSMIPVSDLAAGTYLLRITNSNNELLQTFKIIKN